MKHGSLAGSMDHTFYSKLNMFYFICPTHGDNIFRNQSISKYFNTNKFTNNNFKISALTEDSSTDILKKKIRIKTLH